MRERIFHTAGSDASIDVRVFRWSGRNSVTERGRAALDFVAHLEAALDEDPDSRHVILAHSHGGTVAAHALSIAPIPANAVPRVKAFICMATPFTHLASLSHKTMERIFFGLSETVVALGYLVGAGLGWLPQGPLPIFYS
jgi:pimeloyl-ACP methyl ester carboxylesterase